MAQIIEDIPRWLNGRAGIRYPWREWTDGRARRAIRGEDFHCETNNFRNILYTQARRMGMKAAIRIDNEVVDFQFYTPE